ncbi:MAG TPA: hypothetical protein VL793_11530 [Patescibacteria group bacterium]|nr:hypothetical protein [Patescibacteria group bacterium]
MNEYKKSRTRQQHEEVQHSSLEQQARQEAGREFANVEELLRHDAQGTTVPPGIAQRLQESISQLPPEARRAWWRRILGGSDL